MGSVYSLFDVKPCGVDNSNNFGCLGVADKTVQAQIMLKSGIVLTITDLQTTIREQVKMLISEIGVADPEIEVGILTIQTHDCQKFNDGVWVESVNNYNIPVRASMFS